MPDSNETSSVTTEIIRYAREKRLKWIHLGGNNLTEIPSEIYDLKYLESLDISENRLQTLPKRLSDLPNLRSVNLIRNPIECLPDCPNLNLIVDAAIYHRCRHQLNVKNIHLVIDIKTSPEDAHFCAVELRIDRGLRYLTVGQWTLGIGNNHRKPIQGTQIILNSLAQFTFLESLSLRGLPLGTVPEGIRQLRNLKHLRLDAIELGFLPDWIGQLDLDSFSATDNKLTALPYQFRNFRHLKYLTLSWNPLGQIPRLVFDIASLELLQIRNCGVREIPSDILRLPRLKSLDLRENPIESPPEEVAKEGLDAIRDYWRQRADAGVDYLCEAKLIILGEAGAGKTSLANKIVDPNYKLHEREKSTEGIDVIRYQFSTSIRTREAGSENVLPRRFQVNIWDFGGQEIYHATHQFFLTRRSVYVLVCDDRKEDTDFSYWLHVVEMLSDASPLLIVQNEKQDRKRDINLNSLRAQFGNLRDTLSTNLDTNRGLDHVLQSIKRELENLPHVGVGLPATWKRVREVLEQNPRDYISLEEYLQTCQQYGFTRREDKLQLSGYLHDL